MIPICPTLIGKTLGSEEIYMVSDSKVSPRFTP